LRIAVTNDIKDAYNSIYNHKTKSMSRVSIRLILKTARVYHLIRSLTPSNYKVARPLQTGTGILEGFVLIGRFGFLCISFTQIEKAEEPNVFVPVLA